MSSILADGSTEPIPAKAHDDAVVHVGTDTRFTVLTSQLIRLEHSSSGHFIDDTTQLVVSRDFAPVPHFDLIRTDDQVEILTEHLHLKYIPNRGFSRSGLSISLRQAVLAPHGGTWRFGDDWDPSEKFRTNLGGTARTLDEVDGETVLRPGLLATNGFSVLDDSNSLILQEDQWVRPRPGADPATGSTGDVDLYFFGYGQDYSKALKDFFALTGPTPLLRRAHLGNWWSRYHKYSEAEYLELMDRFEKEKLPFSVAVIDMDWHLVDIDPSLGNGWTGYTWNKDLFPDPPRFLGALHERGMEVSLNLHPAGGIRRHEDAYVPIAKQLGIDPESGQEIPFNIGSPEFTVAYLEHAHHTLEEQGVDLWWIDWQQGGDTSIPGLDPLWMLNHIHYLDSERERSRTAPDGTVETYRRRPATFSRFADASSHRTPIGFSGDTVTSWASLAFQPEFTATAANIGYFWWSHDIGGHMMGIKDSELMARWVQLGCFSPINRLHSSNSVFNSKEPWRFSRDARASMNAHLRLRHRLVPYLYTWSRRAHYNGIGPIRPMYHDYPRMMGAYSSRTQFLFGNIIIVPMVHQAHPQTHLAREKAWLPEGTWFDLPTGRRYCAGSDGLTVSLSRPLEQIPTLARAGSVIVLAENLREPAGQNPQHLGVVVVPGADGGFTLEEDNDSPAPTTEEVVRTTFTLTWNTADERARLEVQQHGAHASVPEYRDLTVHLLSTSTQPSAHCSGAEITVQTRAADGFTLGAGIDIHLKNVRLQDGLSIELDNIRVAPPALEHEAFTIFEPAEIDYDKKDQAWEIIQQGTTGGPLLSALRALDLPDSILTALSEIA